MALSWQINGKHGEAAERFTGQRPQSLSAYPLRL